MTNNDVRHDAVIDGDTTVVDGTTTDRAAYPNHGIDGNSANDPAKGAVGGAVGGAVVGGLAGGPVGAVIGAVAGGVASGAGVAAVDKVDDDNSPNENVHHTTTTTDVP